MSLSFHIRLVDEWSLNLWSSHHLGRILLQVKCFMCLGRNILARVSTDQIPCLLNSGWLFYSDVSFSTSGILVSTPHSQRCMHSKTSLSMILHYLFFFFFLHIFILKNLDKIATNLINWDENDQFRIKGISDGMSRVGKNPSHRGTCKNSLKARFVFCFGITKYQKKLE